MMRRIKSSSKGDLTHFPKWPVFIISLDDAFERRSKLCARLDELKISYEVISAIDGRQGLPAEFHEEVDRDSAEKTMRRGLSDGEFACALSHRKIYHKIIENDILGAIVLEDDAIICREFEHFYKESRYLIAPIVLLDHNKARAYFFSKEKILKGVFGFRVANNPFKTTGYSISATAAKSLAEALSPVASTADWPCDISRLRAVAVMPKLVDHPKDQSASSLYFARNQLLEASLVIGKRSLKKYGSRSQQYARFFTRTYWRLWMRKRLSYPIDYSETSLRGRLK